MYQLLRKALSDGDPEKVTALIDAGADVRTTDEEGYDALIYAVHGRDILHDARLIDLLNVLIARGVPLTGESSYCETGVRVLSHIGRFDAVQLLLKAGADAEDLEMTPLIEAVAFGTLADVEEETRRGPDLEARDYWERTAWLVAIQIGDIAKAQLLLDLGADRDARGRCKEPSLFYAIENFQDAMLKWLLEIGIDIRQTNEFGQTALVTAAECDNVKAIEILLQAGADVNQTRGFDSALASADTAIVAVKLLEAGADPQDLTSEARRDILGYPPDQDEQALDVSHDEFLTHRARRFGSSNPEKMNNPFWEGMIRTGMSAYHAGNKLEPERSDYDGLGPIYCARRFGQSLTFLDDGRIVQIGGEHEDSYDPDFCIYNDVFVHGPNGELTIYGYPDDVFPPTDFHTATLVGDDIYIVGSLGYRGTRKYGETPVYRLNTHTFQMERLATTGHNPGWIYEHRAVLLDDRTIQITDGKILADADGTERHTDNARTFILDIKSLIWSVADRNRVYSPPPPRL